MKTMYFTRVFTNRWKWGQWEGGRGEVNLPPVVQVLNTYDKVDGFVYIREPAIFVYIREPFSFRPTFGEDFRFDRTSLRMYADFCARIRTYIRILVEKVC